jgi:hypothetical protein
VLLWVVLVADSDNLPCHMVAWVVVALAVEPRLVVFPLAVMLRSVA